MRETEMNSTVRCCVDDHLVDRTKVKRILRALPIFFLSPLFVFLPFFFLALVALRPQRGQRNSALLLYRKINRRPDQSRTGLS